MRRIEASWDGCKRVSSGRQPLGRRGRETDELEVDRLVADLVDDELAFEDVAGERVVELLAAGVGEDRHPPRGGAEAAEVDERHLRRPRDQPLEPFLLEPAQALLLLA